ncbi:MAG: hypothetical protein ACQ9MH_18900, partial [Nitrospinales bacterium]
GQLRRLRQPAFHRVHYQRTRWGRCCAAFRGGGVRTCPAGSSPAFFTRYATFMWGKWGDENMHFFYCSVKMHKKMTAILPTSDGIPSALQPHKR